MPPKPITSPENISVRVASGEAATRYVTIRRAPANADVRATIVGGDSLLSVVQMRSFEIIKRKMTEEEIQELPAHPPSIRERARKSVIEDVIEIASAGPNSSLPV